MRLSVKVMSKHSLPVVESNMPMIQVTLPDGEVNEYSTGITAGEVVIDIFGRKHGCVAAFIDEKEMDFSTIISNNCSIAGISAESGAVFTMISLILMVLVKPI